MKTWKVMLLAGEESGVLYADQIRTELASRLCASGDALEVRTYADYGFKVADLAVMGFWAVLRRIGYFLRVKRTMRRAIGAWRPDVLCTVDYPGMNLRLARYARTQGVRTVHVVCPQIWAWRSSRKFRIAESVDRLCCFFPFEPRLFDFRPGLARFVGHPLVEAFGAATGVRDERLVALLPGSRMGEIERNLPVLLAAAERLSSGRALAFSLPAANARAKRAIDRVRDRCGCTVPVEVTLGGARDLLRRAACAAVASGTATLEAALAGCPTVLVYRVSAVLAWFARRVIRGVKHIGLANVIAEKAGVEPPMPELLQEAFTPEGVAEQLGQWLDDVGARRAATDRLARTMALMKTEEGAIRRIATAVLDD